MHASVKPTSKRRLSRGEPPKPITVTINSACAMTGLGRTKIYELIKQRELKTVTIGTRRLVLVSSIEALLQPARR